MTYPKPKDPAKNAANRKLLFGKKNKGKGTNGANAPLSTPKETKVLPQHTLRAPKHHKHNNCAIHDKPHTYNPAKPGWDEDETLPSGLAAALPPPPSIKDDATTLMNDTSLLTSAADVAHQVTSSRPSILPDG